MTDEQRSEIIAKIEHEIAELKRTIPGLREKSQPVEPDSAIGRISRMEAINDKSIQEANLRSSELRLTRLEHALKRSQTEDFGTCYICEEEIPFRRLLLMPETTRCVECAETK